MTRRKASRSQADGSEGPAVVFGASLDVGLASSEGSPKIFPISSRLRMLAHVLRRRGGQSHSLPYFPLAVAEVLSGTEHGTGGREGLAIDEQQLATPPGAVAVARAIHCAGQGWVHSGCSVTDLHSGGGGSGLWVIWGLTGCQQAKLQKPKSAK